METKYSRQFITELIEAFNSDEQTWLNFCRQNEITPDEMLEILTALNLIDIEGNDSGI